MTTLVPKPIVTRPFPVRMPLQGSAFSRILRTTDAKQIGLMYLVTSFIFFLVGGFMALLMRAELARPGLQFLSLEQYNQLFTMHGTDHAAVLRHADRLRLRELHRAAADRRPRRLVPPAQRAGLLAVRVRRHARRSSASRRRAVPPTSDGSPTSRSPTCRTRPASAATCGSWAWCSPASARSSAPST